MSDKNQFFQLLWDHQILRLGDFTLKSGRKSPYFFNFGNLYTAVGMEKLGEFYAKKIANERLNPQVLFGPSYKGIYLSLSTAMAYFKMTSQPIEFASNRKEKKDHGEGGVILGAPLVNKKVLLIDDVLTQGSALKEVMPFLEKIPGIEIQGLLIAIDRQERLSGKEDSAKKMVESFYQIPLYAIATLTDLIQWMHNQKHTAPYLKTIETYAKEYCII